VLRTIDKRFESKELVSCWFTLFIDVHSYAYRAIYRSTCHLPAGRMHTASKSCMTTSWRCH
jgi:hypothetical protein